MRPIPAEEFSTIVGSIYECALDPERWPDVLATVRARLQCFAATLAVVETPSGDAIISAASGLDHEWLSMLPSYGREILEQWGGPEGVARQPLGTPMLLSAVNPMALTCANRYHREVCLARGVADVMSIGLVRDATAFGTVTFSRHEDAGAVAEAELVLTGLLAPHLRRALLVSRILEARRIERATFGAVLDALAVAVLLVGPDLALCHANRAGEAMLRSGDPLGVRGGRVTCDRSLAAALRAEFAAPLDGTGRRGLGVPARRTDGEPLVLHVLPLSDATPLKGATAAIFVAPAVQPPPASVEAVAALFDLTPAEARVLELLGAGRTCSEVGAALGVAVSTVRTHVLRLFDKTGTHRQADLVALLASFSLPIR